MSYILDALRKSEQERARNSPVDVTTLHAPAPEHQRMRLGGRATWIIGTALGLNAVVLLAWLLWPDASERVVEGSDEAQSGAARAEVAGETPSPAAAERTPSSETASESPVRPPAAIARAAQAPEVEVAAASAEVVEPVEAVAATIRDGAASTARTPAQARTASKIEALEQPTSAAEAPAKAAVLSIRDLPARIQRSIPELAFSTHIYGDDRRYREVGINGRRFAEGARVEGMLLEEITETGVVFSHEGYRFEVSVLDDWDY